MKISVKWKWVKNGNGLSALYKKPKKYHLAQTDLFQKHSFRANASMLVHFLLKCQYSKKLSRHSGSKGCPPALAPRAAGGALSTAAPLACLFGDSLPSFFFFPSAPASTRGQPERGDQGEYLELKPLIPDRSQGQALQGSVESEERRSRRGAHREL